MDILDTTGDVYAELRLFLLLLAHENHYRFTSSVRERLFQSLTQFSQIHPEDLQNAETYSNHYQTFCGHKFVKGETCFRCFTCGYDETCALCKNCFDPEYHRGHDIHKSIIQRDMAGCCDCGDKEAYPTSICVHYNEKGTKVLKTHVSPYLLEHLGIFLGILLDFIIDFTSHSISSVSPPESMDQIKLRHSMSSLVQNVYGSLDPDVEKYALLLYSDNVHQYSEAVQRIRFATGKVKEYAEMIATRCDDHGRAVVMVSEHIPYLVRKQEYLSSSGLTSCIVNVREAFREEMVDEIFNWINQLSKSFIARVEADIRNTISLSFLLPYNSGCMNQWIEVYRDKILINPRNIRLANITGRLVKPWDIPDRLKQECRYTDDPKASELYQDSRFQCLLSFDVRFCRATRINLHDIYIPIFAKNPKFSTMVVAQFLDVYDTIFTSFLMIDREPELSVMPILSTQLFSCATNDILILRHQNITDIITSIYRYLSMGLTTNMCKGYQIPDNRNSSLCFNALKNRKWAHVLLDLTYIITRNPEADNIFTMFECFPIYVDLLALFQGKPTFEREAEKHVEYESQDYTVFFNAVSVISHLSENVGKVLSRLTKVQLLSQGNPMDCFYHTHSNTMKRSFTETLYTIIIRKLIDLTFRENSKSSNNSLVNVGEDKDEGVLFSPCKEIRKYNQVESNVLEAKLSFLHPLHIMFSLMIEMDQSVDSDKSVKHIMDIICSEYEFYLSHHDYPVELKSHSYQGVMGIFDIPLRKIVLLSQIKVGLWVRNGTSLKSQMHLYRLGASREFGYMRDLFLCQIYVGYFNNLDLVSYTLFDRWNLLPWLNGEQEKSPYPVAYLPMILEEFILFLIHLVTEDLHLHKRDGVEITNLMIQREIVHSVLYSEKTYKDITSGIGDHIITLKQFPIMFNKCLELSNSVSDISQERTYKLKSHLLDTIDPYYVYFTANRRDNCIAEKKLYISRVSGTNVDEVVLEPKEIDWNDGPFERVTDILLDKKVLSFIESSIKFCKGGMIGHNVNNKNAHKENHESLFTLTLHLLHLALKHKNIDYVSTSDLASIFIQLWDIFQVNAAPESSAQLKCIMKIIFYLLDSRNYDLREEIPHFDFKIIETGINFIDNENKSNTDISFEKKKKLARKKKTKLLAKLKRQREKFAENFIMDEGLDSVSESGTEINRSVDSLNDTALSPSGDSSQVVPEINPVDTSSLKKESHHANQDESIDYVSCGDPPKSWKFPEHQCLLCHIPASEKDEIFGVFSYVTDSNVFRYVPTDNDYWFYKAFGENLSLDQNETAPIGLFEYIKTVETKSVIGPGFPDVNESPYHPGFYDNMAVFTGCCHGMHASCFKHYYETSVDKQLSQITRTVPENIQRNEFICPLCKTICNVFIPVCYSQNSKKFFTQFSESVALPDIMTPRVDIDIARLNTIQEKIRDELLENVKMQMDKKNWFLEKTMNYKASKVLKFKEDAFPAVLQDCIQSVTSVSPPFESFGVIIAKTIESLEIMLRGDDYNPKVKKKLLINQLNSRSLTNIRVWLQISEVFKSTLGVTKGAQESSNEPFLFSQSLTGLYYNLFQNDELLFDGQDYFTGLVHCEEAKCIGFSFKKLASILFVRHIIQSLMKVMVVITDKESKGQHINYDLIIRERYTGDRNKFSILLSSFLSVRIPNEIIDLVYSMTIKMVTPFLRKVLILAYAKYPVFEEEMLVVDPDLRECDKICMVMGIPTVDTVIENLNPEFFGMVDTKQKTRLLNSRIGYPSKIQLIHLPETLNDFYVYYYNSLPAEEQYEEPAICMFCGKMMSLQKQRYGDHFGSCTMHLRWECMNSGKGIFFLPRNNCVLLLDNGKGSFIESPYRDEFGELDRDFKSGHEVTLSDKKYDELQKNIWLSHNIQNVVAQNLENLTDIGGWSTL